MHTLKTIFIVSLLINFFCSTCEAQRRKEPPIVRHSQDSPLPDTINVIGKLSAEPAPGYCGIICLGGTIKVKLADTIPGYPYKFVYLVTACLSSNAKRGTKVNIIATKLRAHEKECYYNSIMNGFDSKGAPFYKLSERETKKVF